MENDKSKFSLPLVKLFVGFFQHTLTKKEHDELDGWVNRSDENMSAFEDLVQIAQRSVEVDPDIPTEASSSSELWKISLIITKHIEQTITEEESRVLIEWMNFSEQNKKAFEELGTQDNLKSLYLYTLQQLLNKCSSGLN